MSGQAVPEKRQCAYCPGHVVPATPDPGYTWTADDGTTWTHTGRGPAIDLWCDTPEPAR